MIDNLIIDLGGIVMPEKREEILAAVSREVGIGWEDLEARVRANRSRIVKGEIGLIDFYSEFLEATGRHDVTAKQVFQRHLEIYQATTFNQRDPQILALIERLKANGYGVHCATNTEREIAEFNKRNGLFDCFQRKYISTDMAMSKDDAAFFEQIFRDLMVDPKQVVLVDNEQRYIKPAAKVGLHTALYGHYKEGYSQLLVDLAKLSIRV